MIFFSEFFLAANIIGTDAEQGNIHSAELKNVITKITGFGSASRGIRLRVEIQNGPAALVIFKSVFSAVLIEKRETWCRAAKLQRVRFSWQQENDGDSAIAILSNRCISVPFLNRPLPGAAGQQSLCLVLI